MQVAYGLNQFSIARPEPAVVIDYWGDLLFYTVMKMMLFPIKARWT